MNPTTKPESKSLSAPLEPDPLNWLTDERRKKFEETFKLTDALLVQAGLWRAAVGYWVRWQASLEAEWEPDEEEKELNSLVKDWKIKNKDKKQIIEDDLLKAKLRVSPAVNRWSMQKWGHKIDSIFLLRKSLLDKASCRVLRIENKHMAVEIYHRIKAGETSFEQAAYEYGEGPEKYNGGLISEQSLARMPLGLGEVLGRLERGRISKPLRLGKGYCLVELISFESCSLDQATTEILLAEQMQLWIDSVVDVLQTELKYMVDQNKEFNH